MKNLNHLISSVVIAAWVMAIAVFSIQNVYLPNGRLVSVQFFPGLSPLELPIGVILAMSIGFGMIGGGVFPFVLSQRQQVRFARKQDSLRDNLNPSEGDWSEERSEKW